MALALQLYSLRREIASNAEAIVRKISSLGFDGIELAGNYGWNADQWRKLIDETGLSVIGAHHGLDDVESQMDFDRAIGNQRLIVSSLPETLRKDYREAARQLTALGKRVKAQGFQFLYHNHAFEFENAGMETLLSETEPGTVEFEVDTYWVERAGHNARDFIRKHADRIGMIHAKDYRKHDGADAPAGQGDVDFPAIISLAQERGWPVVVEYEGENALAAVAESARYLRTL